MKRLALVVLAVLVTAVAAAQAAPTQDAPSHPLQWVAVVENRIWTESEVEADFIAGLIADAEFNTVRIFVPYSPNQAEIDNDAKRLCIAAVAARDNGLRLIVSILGVKGHVPIGWSQVDRFIKTLNDHMYWLFGENGCTQDVDEFTVEIFNEINGKTWWIEPDRYARILNRVYPALKFKGAELGIEVTIIAGALASNDDPLGYIRKMCERGPPLFDVFSHHPYPVNSSESPDTPHPAGNFVGIADYDNLRASLKQSCGYVPPIFYSELGWESEIPKEQHYRYRGKSPESVKPVSEELQGRYYTMVLKMCASQPKVIGCAFFHMLDDPELDKWQSGLYYFSRQVDDEHPAVAKSSLPDVRAAVLEAVGA